MQRNGFGFRGKLRQRCFAERIEIRPVIQRRGYGGAMPTWNSCNSKLPLLRLLRPGPLPGRLGSVSASNRKPVIFVSVVRAVMVYVVSIVGFSPPLAQQRIVRLPGQRSSIGRRLKFATVPTIFVWPLGCARI